MVFGNDVQGGDRRSRVGEVGDVKREATRSVLVDMVHQQCILRPERR